MTADIKETLESILNKINLIDANDIPNIDLYMDQVTTFMESHLGNLKRSPDENKRVIFLSGGNQQKIVVAKWLMSDSEVIILDEPTRGIDVGAKREIYELINDLARAGKAVIVISSDMEEVLGISDRIAVMHEGRIAGMVEKKDFSQQIISEYAIGGAKL